MTSEQNIQTHGSRLSPLSIIHHFSKQLPGIAITIYFVVNGSGENLITLIIGLIFGLFVIPSNLLNYYYFKYLVTSKELIIHSGVLSKKQRVIPINKIQNINITQNFVQRILGISKVQIETAGDVSSEGVLESLKTFKALEIKSIIKEFQDVHQVEDYNKTDEDALVQNEEKLHSYNVKDESIIETERELISMNIKELMTFGILRFRPILFVLVAWIFGVGQQFSPNFINNYVDNIILNAEDYYNSINIIEVIFYSFILFIILLLVSWAMDILLTISQWWNFKLTIYKDKLFISNGLFTRKQGTIPLKKLQMLVIFSNYFRSKFGYWGLMLETAGFGTMENRRPETAIPFAKFDRIKDLISEFININYPFNFKSVSKKTIRRAFNRYLFVIIVLSFVLFLFDFPYYYNLILLPILYYVAILKWQTRGWELQKDIIVIKQGLFFKKIKIIPFNKIQTLNIKRSFFQRRLRLSSFHIDTAASSGINDASIIDIDEKDAEFLMELLSKTIIKNKKIRNIS